MRFNHFLSIVAKISRREADRLITQGLVKVDNSIISHNSIFPDWIINAKDIKDIYRGLRLNKDFKIFIDKKLLKMQNNEKFSAIIYHKSKGELVSTKDIFDRKLIYHSLNSKFSHFMPVGRLDFASEGLLILSDSKEVVSRLMHSNLERTYLIKIDSKINENMLKSMEEGLSISNTRVGANARSKIVDMEFAPMKYKVIKNSNISKLKIIISEGKNRELRRFFAYFNANILDLKRVSYGFLNLNALPVGKTRYFTRQEYNMLRGFLEDPLK